MGIERIKHQRPYAVLAELAQKGKLTIEVGKPFEMGKLEDGKPAWDVMVKVTGPDLEKPLLGAGTCGSTVEAKHEAAYEILTEVAGMETGLPEVVLTRAKHYITVHPELPEAPVAPREYEINHFIPEHHGRNPLVMINTLKTKFGLSLKEDYSQDKGHWECQLTVSHSDWETPLIFSAKGNGKHGAKIHAVEALLQDPDFMERLKQLPPAQTLLRI